MVLTDLYNFLLVASTSGLDSNRAAAIATVRSMAGTQMYAGILDEGAKLPALTYELVDDGTEHTLDGASEGMYHPRVQIDVWTMSSADRKALGLAVKQALDGYSGFMGSGQTDVCVLLWDNEIDGYEPDRKQYHKMLDFRVIHN